jgi:hypothetical protein
MNDEEMRGFAAECLKDYRTVNTQHQAASTATCSADGQGEHGIYSSPQHYCLLVGLGVLKLDKPQ